MSQPTYLCPVCGYDGLDLPPDNHTICPSCGTQFGLDTLLHSVDELRLRWLALGARWWSESDVAPPGWDGRRQVQRVAPYSGGGVTDNHEPEVARVVPLASWSHAVA